jgi:hypothetical protein
MENYIINECITNNVHILSSSGLTSGATIEFDISEARFCGTVGAVTENAETLNISFISPHTDCCSCLSGLTESLNFKFIQCGTENEINISATDFCSEFGSPTTGLTYEIQFASETPFCATFEGLSESGVTDYTYVSGPFLLCEDCGEEPPRSANTESTICLEVCGPDGNTVIVVNPPHPEWTDGYGTQVTQLNMITLGGINGLNN